MIQDQVVSVERTCRRCGIAFVANHGRKVFCSELCYNGHRAEYFREYGMNRRTERDAQWNQESDAERKTLESIEVKLSEYFGIKELSFQSLSMALTGGRSPQAVLVVTEDFSLTYAEGVVSCYDIATQRRCSWVE